MWAVKITVLNSKTLQEYRIWHDRAMEEVDVVLVYNGSNHFNATGKDDPLDDPLFLPRKCKQSS